MTITKGYKATDKNMKCRDVQFVLGEWQEVEGELIECVNGLHFCTELAHTYEFYNNDTDRRFKCEVEEVLEVENQPGVRSKRVARRIKLTDELTITGDGNTGDRNTGDRNTGNENTGNKNTGNWNTGYNNTGDCNTGHKNTGDSNTGNKNTGNKNTGNKNTGDSNTGDSNTGDSNTGDSNTGYKNTGYKNTGDSNTGDWNTGNWNTGNCNTGNNNTGYCNAGNWNTGDRNTGYKNTGYSNIGYCNTGNRNTGDSNTGNRNTGNWNYCNHSAGFFGSIDPRVTSFGIECEYSRSKFIDDFGSLCQKLHDLMQKDDPIDVADFAEIPNITQERLDNLHQKYIESRKSY